LDLAGQLSGKVGAFKIGLELFTRCGPNIVRKIRETGGDVFLDLKFHDIPNTVAHAVRSAVDLDVQMLTIHTCGGLDMMKAAEEAALERAAELGRPAPLVLGVTVLTSMDTNDLNRVGVEHDVARQVERLATLAVEAGLRGLVCSPLEIEMLRGILPHETQLRSRCGRSKTNSDTTRSDRRRSQLARHRPAHSPTETGFSSGGRRRDSRLARGRRFSLLARAFSQSINQGLARQAMSENLLVAHTDDRDFVAIPEVDLLVLENVDRLKFKPDLTTRQFDLLQSFVAKRAVGFCVEGDLHFTKPGLSPLQKCLPTIFGSRLLPV
jgi:orotidine 5'-phosphate decarboxylase subfamily 1